MEEYCWRDKQERDSGWEVEIRLAASASDEELRKSKTDVKSRRQPCKHLQGLVRLQTVEQGLSAVQPVLTGFGLNHRQFMLARRWP